MESYEAAAALRSIGQYELAAAADGDWEASIAAAYSAREIDAIERLCQLRSRDTRRRPLERPRPTEKPIDWIQ